MILNKDKRSFNWDSFLLMGGVTMEDHPEGKLVTWPADGKGMMILRREGNLIGGLDWSGAESIVTEITGLEEFDPSLMLIFMKEGQRMPATFVNEGALPGLRVPVAFELKYLDSNTMFTDGVPGRLKQVVMGKGTTLSEVSSFMIMSKKCFKDQKMILHDVCLVDSPLRSSIESGKLVDELGQWKPRTWEGKTASREEMVSALNQELAQAQKEPSGLGEGFSRFGGNLAVRYEAAGFFRTVKDGGRWYLADPDGYQFISTGVDLCSPYSQGKIDGLEHLFDALPDPEKYAPAYEGGEKQRPGRYVSLMTSNLMDAFGDSWYEKWARLTGARMDRWGFNTVGNWSEKEFIEQVKKPYVWPLAGFPTTDKKIFRDFPDVFSEEYRENSEKFASQLEDFAGDPLMIGYFLRNEPEWAFVQNLHIAEKVLENPESTVCKDRFIEKLRAKYGTIDALNGAWEKDYKDFADLRAPQKGVADFSEQCRKDLEDFSREMIREYVKVPSLACRAVDPQHMNLGMRYSQLVDPILLEGSEYFDIFSLNGYQESPYEEVQKAGEITGKPVLIGEFHFGAPDAGMLSAGIISVRTQKDRGLAYRAYFEGGLKSPYFVGAHYFILNDQAVLGRFDGENMNNGLVDVCSRPYAACVAEMARFNKNIYGHADGSIAPENPEVNRIPRLMGF